ncbi:hypothetical protein [Mycobacterium sp. E2479]|uniref:hypothetical protein n=1 Tax=Mycobacterium sp. E2479 TaxID=1834134 RepID=UPI0012EAD3FA|nr:hypothetical protein [Mycobacterium sp. E2479]
MQLEDAKAAMAAIRGSFAREAATIRNSSKYSDEGRAQQLAKSLLAHRKQAAALRANFSADNEDVRSVSVSRLFGLPKNSDAATVIAYRDAADRAVKLADAHEAKATLTRAIEMGDSLMARAIAGHAERRKWGAVTDAYAAHAGLEDDLADLRSVPTGGLLKTGLNALFAVPTPAELHRTTDNELQRIADGD